MNRRASRGSLPAYAPHHYDSVSPTTVINTRSNSEPRFATHQMRSFAGAPLPEVSPHSPGRAHTYGVASPRVQEDGYFSVEEQELWEYSMSPVHPTSPIIPNYTSSPHVQFGNVDYNTPPHVQLNSPRLSMPGGFPSSPFMASPHVVHDAGHTHSASLTRSGPQPHPQHHRRSESHSGSQISSPRAGSVRSSVSSSRRHYVPAAQSFANRPTANNNPHLRSPPPISRPRNRAPGPARPLHRNTSLGFVSENFVLPTRPAPRARRNSAGDNLDNTEDGLAALAKYDVVFICDDSSSMAGPRWFQMRHALMELCQIGQQYDSDGIDLHFLNCGSYGLNLQSAGDVREVFEDASPRGPTPIGDKLEELLLEYMERLECAKALRSRGCAGAMQNVKYVNFIVLTDGVPTDDPESVIVSTARRLDAGHFPISQVGIQFVQVGNDSDATAYLRELDDLLQTTYNVRDIVDTEPYNGQALSATQLSKIMLGGINRRVDNRGCR